MWLATNFGWFSATKRTDKIPAGDNRTLQIRARELAHLEALRVFMGDSLGPTIEIPNRDYQARAYATPEAWGRALYDMSMDIDYGNFKSSVKDNTLHNAYMKVWSAMADAYGTGYSKGGSYAGWTDYRSTGTSKYPAIKKSTDHAYVAGQPDDQWCRVVVGGKACEFLKHEHKGAATVASTPPAATPGKRGSRRGKELALPDQGDDVAGAMARIADGLDRLGYSDKDIAAMSEEDVEELLLNASDAEDLLDDATDILSLHKAAKKIGCNTKELREFMLSKPEWAKFREDTGFSWLIPESEIDELEFKYWAEVGTTA